MQVFFGPESESLNFDFSSSNASTCFEAYWSLTIFRGKNREKIGTGKNRDVYDLMRFMQLARTDFHLQFFHPLEMNDLQRIGLYLAFFQFQRLSSQAFDASKNIKDSAL